MPNGRPKSRLAKPGVSLLVRTSRFPANAAGSGTARLCKQGLYLPSLLA